MMDGTTRATTKDQPLFDLKDNWNAPRFRWHDHYPENAAPGCIYPEIRVEHFLELAADRFPDRRAIQFFSSDWTYRELLARVRRVAGHLQRMGVGPGDRALLVLPNCPEFIVLWFALHYLGAEIVHGSPLYPGCEVANLIRRTRPKILVGLDVRLEPCVDALKELRGESVPYLIVTSIAPHLPVRLRTIYGLKTWLQGSIKVPAGTRIVKFPSLYSSRVKPVEQSLITDVDRIAVLQPTGGTTGSPKLAMITHRNLVAQVGQSFMMAGRKPGTDTVLAILPFFHVYGSTVIMLTSIASAASLILLPRFDARQVADILHKQQPTCLAMVPFMFQALNEELTLRPRKIDSLELVTSGASPLDPQTREIFEAKVGIAVTEGYGLSEASPILTTNIGISNKPGTVGLPLPDTEIRIVDPFEGTKEMPAGEVGELIARGPQIMKGYLDNPEETLATLRDGWLYTGDLATIDEQGYVQIVDRKKDMIISGGLNVFPSEVEAKLLGCAGVAECAVVGHKDPRWGEKVVAFVVPSEGTTLDIKVLKEHCKQTMAQYKVPREFQIVDKLPTSFLGKLRRTELRALASSNEGESTAAAS
jgi:long-chain acyl-CoA synthetase